MGAKAVIRNVSRSGNCSLKGDVLAGMPQTGFKLSNQSRYSRMTTFNRGAPYERVDLLTDIAELQFKLFIRLRTNMWYGDDIRLIDQWVVLFDFPTERSHWGGAHHSDNDRENYWIRIRQQMVPRAGAPLSKSRTQKPRHAVNQSTVQAIGRRVSSPTTGHAQGRVHEPDVHLSMRRSQPLSAQDQLLHPQLPQKLPGL